MKARQQRVAFVVGALLGIVVVGLVASPGNPLLFVHAVCNTTNLVAERELLTPDGVTNAPFHGYVNYTAIYDDPWHPDRRWTFQTPYSNAMVGGFNLMNWSLYRTVTDYVLGPGPSQACPSPWRAVLGGGSPGGFGLDGGLWGATSRPSDIASPSTISDQNQSSVVFDVSYHANNAGTINTCGGLASHMDLASRLLTVKVPFVVANNSLLVEASVPVQLYVNYTFDANSGVWLVDDLNPGPDAPGTGLATVWSAC
ncbi:MAG: hypothetical protein L3K14_06255 [Thermoplasmata archaeon]|nr:hypothetical protein [Thermoplasmata archaeon]